MTLSKPLFRLIGPVENVMEELLPGGVWQGQDKKKMVMLER
jgi:hypothetical protein